MTTQDKRPPRTAAAHALAMMVAANGRADPRELQALEELEAFSRLGVPRHVFEAMVQACLEGAGVGLAASSWLHARDQAYVDQLLDAVTDPQERLLVCRLGAAVLMADGCLSWDERLVFDHALARWHVSRSMLTQAILHDRTPAAGRHARPLAARPVAS